MRKTVRNVDEQVGNDDGGCVLGSAAHPDRLHQDAGILRRFRAHAAMCAFGIDRLCQHPGEKEVNSCLVSRGLYKVTGRSTPQI